MQIKGLFTCVTKLLGSKNKTASLAGSQVPG